MTGEEGMEEEDIEEEIRRELEALNDWEVEDVEKYETENMDLPSSTSPGNSKDEQDSGAPESVETYIRLLQSRHTKLEDDLAEVQDVVKPSYQANKKDFQKTDGADEEISEEVKEKMLLEIEEFESNDSNGKISHQYNEVEESISSLEEMGLKNLKELEERQHLKNDRLENIFNELKEEEMLRRQQEETIRKENKRKADKEYKMKVEENQIIKLKLEEEAKCKQRKLKELEMMLKIEMENFERTQEEERLALQKLKDEEVKKLKFQKENACITVQKNYKRYRVMSEHGAFLKIKREERRKRRQEELEALERKEIELMEEAVRKAKEEEERRLKEIEVEKKRKRQEKEERRRMEEERKKKDEEERRREEEERVEKERKKREDERMKREEEERRNREKEEEKKQREEEEKKRVEEEKMEAKKVEDERRKLNEQEKKRVEEETRKREGEEEVRRVQKERYFKIDANQDITIKSDDSLTSLPDNDKSHGKPCLAITNTASRESKNRDSAGGNALPNNRETTNKYEMNDVKYESSISTSDYQYHKCLKSRGGELLVGLSSEMEIRRIEWLKRTVPWSSVSTEENKTNKSRSRSRRPLSASQKLPSVSEEEIAKSLNKFTFLEQVVRVHLKDLPARNLKIMLRCPNIKTVTVHNCGLLSAESFENCKNLRELNLSDNCIQNVNCQNIGSLEQLDFSKNQLTSVHGLDGCSNLRSLKLDGNRITRIGSISSNKVMNLSLQNNQLITTKGLSQMKYIQTLDCSNNFLNHIEQLESCPLLRILKLRGNNLQKPPILVNHVLLREIHLSENSITSLESLSDQWLPLLQYLYVDNNSLSSLSSLRGLPLLETLDIRNNLISDEDNLIPSLVGCDRLRDIRIHGNPVCEDSNIKPAILRTLPSLDKLDDEDVGKNLPKNETSNQPTFFLMCVTQIGAQDEMLARHEAETGNVQCESNDDDKIIERLIVQSRQFSELQDLIIQHRLQHEKFQQVKEEKLADVLVAKHPETTPNVVYTTTQTRPAVGPSKEVDDVPLKQLKEIDVGREEREGEVDPEIVTRSSQTESTSGFTDSVHHHAAIRIQARYRGFRIRKRYLEATKSAHYQYIDTGEEDEFNFDEEVDLSMFDVDEAALDSSWIPRTSEQFSPSNPTPRLDSPPNQQTISQQFATYQPQQIATYPTAKEERYRPFPPRQAWRSPDSPVSQHNPRRVVPPIDATTVSEEASRSENTTERSHRTSELSSEWGFSKNTTAELMLKRAKKMKYNALRKKKLNDPGKRLERFKKTEEANKVHGVQPIQKKKEKKRVDYFTGRDSRYQQSSEKSTPTKNEDEKAKEEMTFSWVYNQAVLHEDNGDEILRDTKGYIMESLPVKNRHERSPPVSLPRMDPVILAGRHLHLVASPVGNPRPSPINDDDSHPYSKNSWNQEKTHSNPDLTRAGLSKVDDKREKSNSADARIIRERNKFLL